MSGPRVHSLQTAAPAPAAAAAPAAEDKKLEAEWGAATLQRYPQLKQALAGAHAEQAAPAVVVRICPKLQLCCIMMHKQPIRGMGD